MDLQLTGDTAIVFGAARGLGFAIASAFAREGCRVVLTDVSPTVHAAAAQITDARSHVLDVTDYPAVCAAVEQTRSEFGRVDHAVFAVAVASGKFGFPFWNLEPADWDRVLKV